MKVLQGLIITLFSFVLAEACAATGHLAGIGGVAQNLMDPVGLFSDFVYSGCIIIGGSFVFASVIKYFEHKRSPLMVPISTVIFLFIAGALLLLLPFLSYLNTHGTRYSLFR